MEATATHAARPTAPPTSEPRQTSSPTPAGRLIAATGAQAAAAAESLVCGLAAVTLPAVAQGIALSGHRAASLAWEGAGDLASNLAGFPAGYVQHRRRRGGDRTAAAVELTPGSVQEAADYALVAHRIADRIGRPVVCSMDEGLAESLGFVRLPAPDVVRGLFGDKSAAAPADRGEEHLARVADEAFRDVALATRRPCQVVTRYQTGDADVVLVAGGYDADRAHAAAGILRDRGHKAGVVSVGLIRPFPKAAIVDALSGKARVIVIGSGDLFLVVGDALAKAGAKPAAFESYTPAGGGALAIVSRVAGENGTPIPGFAGWRVASRPAGAWSERLLRDLAAGIALRTPVDVATSAPAAGTAVLEISARGYGAEASSEDAAGTLFVAHPSLVDPNDAAIAGGGTLVLNAKAAGPAGAWRLLSETQRRMIEDRKIAAYAVDLASATSGASDRAAAVRWAAAGALLSAARESAAPIVRAGDVTDAVREALFESGETERAGWFAAGAKAVRRIDAAAIEEASRPVETNFRPASRTPRMPVPREADAAWSASIHRFHATSRRDGARSEALPCLPLVPATPAAWFASDDARDEYPFFVPEADGSPASLMDTIGKARESLSAAGADVSAIADHAGLLVRTAARIVAERGGVAPVGPVLDEAIRAFVDGIEASDAAMQALGDQATLLRGALPEKGRLIGLSRRTPMELLSLALSEERARVLDGYTADAKTLSRRLRDILAVDATHDEAAGTPEALESVLGSAGRLFDAGALSKTLPAHRGARRLDPARRERIERALAALDRFAAGPGDAQGAVFVFRKSAEPPSIPDGVTAIVHEDAPAAAIGLFDGLAEDALAILRSLRIGRLEADDAYEPDRHDEPIAGLSWEGCTASELMLVRPVVVFESAAHLRAEGLGSLSELLRSARPVRVVIADDGAPAEPSARFFRDPALLAVSHREAFVLRSTLARPGHVLSGLRRAVTAPCPAVAVVAQAADGAAWPAGELEAAHAARVAPCFVYDPARGETWATRFDLSENPQPEKIWPTATVRWLDSDGAERSAAFPMTPAHAAALDGRLRDEFSLLPEEAWDEDQLEAGTFLETLGSRQGRVAPFIWNLGAGNVMERAVFTRPVAFACWDRARSWRMLQELAGIENEYARRAAESARESALADAQIARQALDADHAREIERVRQSAAGEAMDRLVSVLLDLDTAPAPRPAAAVLPPSREADGAPPAAAVPAIAESASAPAAEDEVSFDEPYIDSFLCTSCNECIGINPQMFQYNGNKQAFLADASKGTFDELVRAAEKCPARCIHPAKPRAGDTTVNDDLLKRAAVYN